MAYGQRLTKLQLRLRFLLRLASTRRLVQFAQLLQLLANLDFQPARYRLVKARVFHAIGQIALTRGKAALFTVRVAIVFAIVQLLH